MERNDNRVENCRQTKLVAKRKKISHLKVPVTVFYPEGGDKTRVKRRVRETSICQVDRNTTSNEC